MKRFLLLMVIACASTAALAQKAEAALVVGETFTSNASQSFTPILSPFDTSTINSSHEIFVQGAFAVRGYDAKVGALYLEIPVAGVSSQGITVGSPATTLDHLTSIFITPGVKLKMLPSASISPWASAGFGLAHYSSEGSGVTNKGALQFGGGLDFKTRLKGLALRAEVRDFLTADPKFALVPPRTGSGGLQRHNVLLGGGFVLRF
jgi:hypothetical protein